MTVNDRSLRRVEWALFGVLFLSFAYFYQGGGANQNARFDQMRALAEQGRLHINSFAGNSHDVVRVGDRLYPNKAPGMSLVGAVPYFVVSRVKGPLVRLFSEDVYHLFSCYLVTLLIVALPCALGGIVFFRLLRLLHPSVSPALLCTLGVFLGTPVFAYSTVVYGHVVGAVLVVCSFYLQLRYAVHDRRDRRGLFLFLAGLSGGWAVVTEYPTAALVGMLSLYCFVRTLLADPRRALGYLWVAAGAALCVAVLLSYNHAVFGRAFTIAYFDETAPAHAGYRDGGLLGLSLKKINMAALYQTSFGPKRGFFYLSPFLLLIFPGTWFLARPRGWRGLVPVLWVMILTYFLLNTMYTYWYGGKALGPRHAMEMLPFMGLLAYGFVVAYPRFSSLFVAASVFLMLTATAVQPEADYVYMLQPFRTLYFPCFFDGNLSLNTERVFQANMVVSPRFNAFNVGEVFGLRGGWSLVPLYVGWLTGGWFMVKQADDARDVISGAGVAAGLGPSRVVVALLTAILAVQVVTLVHQVDLKGTVQDAAGLGAARVLEPAAPVSGVAAPAAPVAPAPPKSRTSPGHRLQVWEVLEPFEAGARIKVMLQHAEAGREGGFTIVAYTDKDNNGKPDAEVGRSGFLMAREAGDWSYHVFDAPAGRLFTGNTWNEGAIVYFERVGWKTEPFSPVMFYSRQGPPVLSTAPRSTAMAIEVVRGR